MVHNMLPSASCQSDLESTKSAGIEQYKEPLMRVSPFSRVGKRRRAKVDTVLNVINPKVLEIGAFDNATFWCELGDNVKYTDFFSKEELLELYAGNPRRRLDKLVDVDFVVKDGDFANKVGGNYDLVIANHVVEHVPDLIGWLKQISAVLKPNGMLFLSIPDKNYTFDVHRPLSTWIDVIRAHEDLRTKPDALTIAQAKWYHTRVDKTALWDGEAPAPRPIRSSLAEIISESRIRSQDYVDTHCWVFVPSSFEVLMQDLASAQEIDFDVQRIDETEYNTSEFHAILKKH